MDILKKINRAVFWCSKGFTNGQDVFTARDVNCSLKDFEKNHGFRIKPGFVVDLSEASGSDAGEAPDSSEVSDESPDGDTSEEENNGPGSDDDASEALDTPHSENSAYECSICGKKFTNSGYLNRHTSRVHSSIKYPCSKCGKSYSRDDTLRKHILSSHKSVR
jgi:DNA-directed RNA polymerase subunit RPC12/RpoP